MAAVPLGSSDDLVASLFDVGPAPRKDTPLLSDDEATIGIREIYDLADTTVGQIDTINAVRQLPNNPYPHIPLSLEQDS